MASLVVPNACQVRFVWTASGVPFALNVLGARKVGAVTVNQALANSLGAAIKSAFTSGTLDSRLHSSIALASVGIRDISAANLPEFMEAGAPAPGTGATGLLPPQVALCATLRTNRAGKSYRGRYYQCGWDQSSNTASGASVAAAGTDLAAFLSACVTAFTNASLAMCVISRTLLTTTDVNLVQVRDAQWDTIRRRAVPGI